MSELRVFRHSHKFTLKIYKITSSFPSEEKLRLVDQLIRASYSIPSNITEGQNRNTTKDYLNFLYNARGSAFEIKYFLLLSRDLNYISNEEFQNLTNELISIIKMLNSLINSLRKKIV